MAYTINLTDGTLFATVADGTINTSSSMTLVGKNYAGYGAFLDENFIHLLENSSNTTAPGAPLDGQLWWDSGNLVMKVYNGTTWKTISSATASASAPTSNVTGDLWWDTTNNQLKAYNGSGFTLVGPASSSGQGNTGAVALTVTDTGAVDHFVLALYSFNTAVAMVSKDSTFTPAASVSGWGTQAIQPGVTLSTASASYLFQGTAYDSNRLGGNTASAFLRSDEADTTTGTLGVLNDSGLTVGLDQDAKISVVTANSEVVIQNVTQDANISIKVNDNGSNVAVMTVDGAASQVVFPTSVKVTSLLNNNANGVGNIGNSSGYFNTIFATATTALYADVAERFHADIEMLPGTVVELGGTAEITTSTEELSEKVFGVVSTKAAYLMNAGAGTNETHPPVAMTGRVPVRVIGSIRKGDRLVSAGNGIARAAQPGEATWNNTIGRALEDRLETTEGMVEAIVTIK